MRKTREDALYWAHDDEIEWSLRLDWTLLLYLLSTCWLFTNYYCWSLLVTRPLVAWSRCGCLRSDVSLFALSFLMSPVARSRNHISVRGRSSCQIWRSLKEIEFHEFHHVVTRIFHWFTTENSSKLLQYVCFELSCANWKKKKTNKVVIQHLHMINVLYTPVQGKLDTKSFW